LIFGGFDSSRFAPNSASFTLNEDITRDIVVAIQSITYSGTTQSTLLSTPVFAFIESTDPNIWLPEAACKAFEDAFGLAIDKAGHYLINGTKYLDLQKRKSSSHIYLIQQPIRWGDRQHRSSFWCLGLTDITTFHG
jgi:hypothetical protein